MRFWLIIITLLFVAQRGTAQKQADLYPVCDNNRWGYIDRDGQLRIPLRFKTAGPFSEGLAPVREEGLFGYIDERGAWAIKARFDFAEPFEDSVAIAYLGPKPYLIDHKGRILFDHPYEKIRRSGHPGLWLVGVPDGWGWGESMIGKWGAVDKAGRLVLDTVYSRLAPFVAGAANAAGPWNDSIVNGQIVRRTSSGGFVIDASGNKLGSAAVQAWEQRKRGASVAIMPKQIGEYSAHYFGAQDSSGKVLFSDTSWKSMTDFSGGRAFVYVKNGWQLIDTKGRSVSGRLYSYLVNAFNGDETYLTTYADRPYFLDGTAVVLTADSLVVIDTGGTILTRAPANFQNLRGYGFKRFKNIVRIHKHLVNYKYDTFLGFWNIKTGAYSGLKYQALDAPALNYGPAFAGDTAGNPPVWISPDDEVLFRVKDFQRKGRPLDISYKMQSATIMHSSYKAENAEGWDGSLNFFRRSRSEILRDTTKLILRLAPPADTLWFEQYPALRLDIINPGRDTVQFRSSPHQLYLFLEAKDSKGEWCSITHLSPQNDYNSQSPHLFLPPAHEWNLILPRFSGSFKTRVRARLSLVHTQQASDIEDYTEYFSNEIDGSVNPGQFWRERPGFFPFGFSDPYTD